MVDNLNMVMAFFIYIYLLFSFFNETKVTAPTIKNEVPLYFFQIQTELIYKPFNAIAGWLCQIIWYTLGICSFLGFLNIFLFCIKVQFIHIFNSSSIDSSFLNTLKEYNTTHTCSIQFILYNNLLQFQTIYSIIDISIFIMFLHFVIFHCYTIFWKRHFIIIQMSPNVYHWCSMLLGPSSLKL